MPGRGSREHDDERREQRRRRQMAGAERAAGDYFLPDETRISVLIAAVALPIATMIASPITHSVDIRPYTP